MKILKESLELLLLHTYSAQDKSSIICHTIADCIEVEKELEAELGIEYLDTYHLGLCSIVRSMYINDTIDWDERYQLLDYIDTHKPKNLPKERDTELLVSTTSFYWLPGNWLPRINWINKHIQLQK